MRLYTNPDDIESVDPTALYTWCADGESIVFFFDEMPYDGSLCVVHKGNVMRNTQLVEEITDGRKAILFDTPPERGAMLYLLIANPKEVEDRAGAY